MKYQSVNIVESDIQKLLDEDCLGIHYLCHNASVKHAVQVVYDTEEPCNILQEQLLSAARVLVPFDLCPWVYLLETEAVLLEKQHNKHLYKPEERQAHNHELHAWQNRGLTGALAYAFEAEPLGVFDEEIYRKYYGLSTEVKKKFLRTLLLQYQLTTGTA